MKIFTSLQILLCLFIITTTALPRHKREINPEDKPVENTVAENKPEEKLEENLSIQPETKSSEEGPKHEEKKDDMMTSSVDDSKNPKEFNYASLQSQIIATNILKDNVENAGNEVFSPLGISSILAILAEGSQGDTYKEFQSALGYPEDKVALRESFKNILQVYKSKEYDTTPSFKTWFYIYRNNTAKDEYKDILRNYYKAEVKEIDDVDFDWDKPKTATSYPPLNDEKLTSEIRKENDETEKVDEIQKLNNLKTDQLNVLPSGSIDPEQSSYQDLSGNNNSNSKDIIEFEELKKSDFVDGKSSKLEPSTSSSSSSSAESKETSIDKVEKQSSEKDMSNSSSEEQGLNSNDMTNRMDDDMNAIGEIMEIEKEASKFDAVVDDKQYVEVPIIKAEIAKEIEEKRKREEKDAMIPVEIDVVEIIKNEPSTSATESLTSDDKTSKELEMNKEEKIDEIKESISQAEIQSNIVNAVMNEMEAEKVALDDFLKETNSNNKELVNEMTEAEKATIDELKKEEKLIENIVQMKESSSSAKEITEPIEIPMENPEKTQIRRVDLVDVNDEENETISQDEKIDVLRKHNKDGSETIIFIESKEPNKITLPIKKFDDETGEIMEAMETNYVKAKISPRSLLQKDDIASALSANSITGRENSSKTKMLLFNGLYYRGNWAHPFMELRCDIAGSFYTAAGKSVPIKMMKTRGSFKMAKLDSLDSDALELPYENERFSFIVIVPKQKDGLSKLIEKIQPVDLQMLQTRLTDTLTTINLPKFEIEQTSRSEKTMKRLGINKIFSAYTSNMGDMSDEAGLHVDEIVQHVNLRVDEGAASENALSASNSLAARSVETEKLESIETEEERHFDVNRPFLYFVMDKKSNFVIVAGKLLQPQIKEEFGFDS